MPAREDLERMILTLFEREGTPLSASAIRSSLARSLQPSLAELKEVLGSMERRGTIFSESRRRFTTTSPEIALRGRVESTLALTALTLAALTKIVRAPRARVAAILDDLVAGGKVQRHPPLGRRRIAFSSSPPAIRDYLEPEIKRLLAKMKKLGFGEGEIRKGLAEISGVSPERGDDDATRVLDAIRQLNPQASTGALVFIPHLRVALQDRFSDKGGFDRILLALLAQGKIELQSHPTPSILTAPEKSAMIDNGRGSYYMLAGLKVRDV